MIAVLTGSGGLISSGTIKVPGAGLCGEVNSSFSSWARAGDTD